MGSECSVEPGDLRGGAHLLERREELLGVGLLQVRVQRLLALPQADQINLKHSHIFWLAT